jgi:hypothetical protein
MSQWTLIEKPVAGIDTSEGWGEDMWGDDEWGAPTDIFTWTTVSKVVDT